MLGVQVKLYFAGNTGNSNAEASFRDWGARNRLISFADKDSNATESFKFLIEHPLEEVKQDTSVFLDSGAFSAWSRGATINLNDYCGYVRCYHERLAVYANLDVIGDWRGSARNLDRMMTNGLAPMAVFHKGSPWSELDRLAKTAPQVALGGLVGRGKSITAGNIQLYLDQCWATLRKHWPIKVHVFGVVAQWVLERYPWYSADSSTAIVSAGMGRVQDWTRGRVVTDNWILYAKRTMNGHLVDGVASNRVKNGSAYPGRREHNVQCQLALERHVSRLWLTRGVEWDRGGNYRGSLC